MMLDPPYDDEVEFFSNVTVRVFNENIKINPQGSAKKAKFCPICNYPIHIRIVSKPCCHYFCN